MASQSVRATLNQMSIQWEAVQLPVDNSMDFERNLSQNLPAVFIVSHQHLGRIRKLVDVVVDRGTKHPSAHLAKIFLERGDYSQRIPVLEATFRSAAKLSASLAAFLKQLHKKEIKRAYVIGTSSEILNDILKRVRGSETREVKDPWLEGMAPIPQDIAVKLAAEFIGTSAQAERVRRLIYRASRVDSTVLILGETGTGKGVVAQSIHDLDERKDKTIFCRIDCAAMPKDLLGAELFGYVQGTFAGADADREGMWESARGGTLFLDEIGDIHMENQARILRALETNTISPMGSPKEIPIGSVRVLAATNRDLDAMVKAGQFREDLYYRLVEFLIRTPSLRDHPEDIAPLAQCFWETTVESARALPEEILVLLRSYSWPGNARELKLVLKALAVFARDKMHPTAQDLALVFRIQDISSGLSFQEEDALRKIGTLRHLRRVDEVLLTWWVKVRPLVRDGFTDEATVRSALSWIHFRLDELKDLCKDSSVFGSEDLFLMVYGLAGKMTVFQGLLRKGVSPALEYWQGSISEDFRRVSSKLSQDVDRLLKEARDYGV